MSAVARAGRPAPPSLVDALSEERALLRTIVRAVEHLDDDVALTLSRCVDRLDQLAAELPRKSLGVVTGGGA